MASAEEAVFALTMLPLVLMVGFGIFRVDWGAVTTPPAAGDVDWRLFIQIMFWTSTYWQKVSRLLRRLLTYTRYMFCVCYRIRNKHTRQL